MFSLYKLIVWPELEFSPEAWKEAKKGTRYLYSKDLRPPLKISFFRYFHSLVSICAKRAVFVVRNLIGIWGTKPFS